jgi:hypothetical protein
MNILYHNNIVQEDLCVDSTASPLPLLRLVKDEDDCTGDSGMETGGSLSTLYLPRKREYTTIIKEQVKESPYTSCSRKSKSIVWLFCCLNALGQVTENYASVLKEVIDVLESPEVQKMALAEKVKVMQARLQSDDVPFKPKSQLR